MCLLEYLLESGINTDKLKQQLLNQPDDSTVELQLFVCQNDIKEFEKIDSNIYLNYEKILKDPNDLDLESYNMFKALYTMKFLLKDADLSKIKINLEKSDNTLFALYKNQIEYIESIQNLDINTFIMMGYYYLKEKEEKNGKDLNHIGAQTRKKKKKKKKKNKVLIHKDDQESRNRQVICPPGGLMVFN